MTVSVKAPTSTTGSIQLNGSDVLTIDSSGNLTAPNNLTVTGSVSGGSGLGKILQVVHDFDNTQETTTSTSYVASSLTASITPSSTSSKILIMMKSPVTNPTPATHVNVTLYRDATDLGIGGEGMCFYYFGSTTYVWTEVSMNYIDSPSTTSAITYKCYFKARTGGTAYLGATESSRHLILMEIAG